MIHGEILKSHLHPAFRVRAVAVEVGELFGGDQFGGLLLAQTFDLRPQLVHGNLAQFDLARLAESKFR